MTDTTETKPQSLRRLGMSQLQCELRSVFRSEPQARAMLSGLGRIADYLGADYLVVHARMGSSFLSEEFSDDFDPSDQLRDVINTAMSDAMGKEQALCVRLRTEEGAQAGPTVIAALLHDEENETIGAAAIMLRACDRERAVEVFSAFEGILGFVSLLITQSQAMGGSSSDAAARAGGAIASPEAHVEDPVEMCFHIAGYLCNRHSLDQVAVGFVRGNRVRIAAISGMDDLRRSNPGVKWIRDAMEEGLDAGQAVLHATDYEEGLAPDCDYPLHRQWSAAVAGDTVATFPLLVGEQIVGMISVRQAAGCGLQERNLAAFQQELEPYARMLPLAQRATRGVCRHLCEEGLAGMRKLAGTTKRRVIASAVCTVALLCWLMFGTLSYSVAVPGRLTPAASQRVSCPQDGILRQVYARVGETVREGQVLAELDTRMDGLQAAELQARMDALAVEADRALAEASPVERRVIASQRRALLAELAIVEARIESGRIRAAVAGVVVSGDPRDRIGYPLQAGYELFELADIGRVRLLMSVPEMSIVHAREARVAEFVPAARSHDRVEVVALRFPPAATPSDDGMVFDVEAMLTVDDSTGVLLPGMEGVVYMELGARNAWWVLTHRITDWLRLNFWI